MNYYIVASRLNGGAVRIIKAKSRNAAMRHVFRDQWVEPAVASVEDVALAATNGVKPETADESA